MGLTPEQLLEEELRLVLPRFGNTEAWRLGSWLVERCRREAWSPTVAITRAGQRLFHYAFEGTCIDQDRWVERKARTVHRFGHSSWYMGLTLTRDGTTAEARYFVSQHRYCFYPGGVPIALEGSGVVGCLSLSGLPGDLDHTLGVEALKSL